MTHDEKRIYLIEKLLKEQPEYGNMKLPKSENEQRRLLRALFNVRSPMPVSESFLAVQDEYLKEEISKSGITDVDSLDPEFGSMYIWQGDITTLKCDAIVNAANSRMLGCFVPCHGCIDNAIHTKSGIQLRLKCAEIMSKQGHDEPVGSAKITPAYNLPCRYILHTVGPIIFGEVSESDRGQLASCYRACMELAAEYGCRSIAFCCISTGEFHFPNELAADIAIAEVGGFLKEHGTDMKVIFNVFKDIDRDIYERKLGEAKCLR